MEAHPETPARTTWTGVTSLALVGVGVGWLLRQALVPELYYLEWIAVVPAFIAFAALAWVLRAAALRRSAALRDRWSALALVLAGLAVVAVALQLPMKVGFLWVKHPLTRATAWQLPVEGRLGPYTFAPGPRPDYCGTRGITAFPLVDAGDMAAFVHAPGGIDGLCFSEGAAGHLMGDWYWKVDD